MLNNGAKREKKKAGSDKDSKLSPLFIFKLLLLAISFMVGYLLGKYGGNVDNNREKLPCRTTKKSSRTLPVSSDSESDTPCYSGSSSLCPSFYSPNKSLAVLTMGGSTAPTDIFPFLHHPTSPVQWGFYLTSQPKVLDEDGNQISNEILWGAPKKNNRKKKKKKNSKEMAEPPTPAPSPRYGECKELYLTRTGSFKNQPNKCVSIVVVKSGYESIIQQSHRYGFTALKTDQYTNDFPIDYNGEKKLYEMNLMRPFLEEYKILVDEFLQKMGNPIDEVTGERKLAIVMVANEGVMDLLLNFLCSAEEINLNLKSIIVFVGDEKSIALVENMGANAIYSPALGSMPSTAAKFYMDDTFARLMWFKTTSVYLALVAGFNVLFQDVDLVWLKDPFHYLVDLHYDLIFMDDGQMSPRYTPYYVNSGFYFVQYNNRTLYLFEKMIKCGASEIQRTHSHQQVLIRHISEAHHLYGLSVYLLDMDLFPSGQRYHENKPYIRRIQAREYRPYVFHMCWTENRADKVIYFKDVGLWYLPDADSAPLGSTCNVGSEMLRYAVTPMGKTVNIREKCCLRERYWPLDEKDKIVSVKTTEKEESNVNEREDEEKIEVVEEVVEENGEMMGEEGEGEEEKEKKGGKDEWEALQLLEREKGEERKKNKVDRRNKERENLVRKNKRRRSKAGE